MLIPKKIISIEMVGKEKVYDISVEDNHNFLLSNNILSHNSDTKNLIEGQEDLLCIKEISLLDIRDILEKLSSEKRMSRRIKASLAALEQQEMVIVERRQKAILIKRLQPPRCMCYKNKSFLKVWNDKINKWIKTYEYMKEIYEINNQAKKKIANIEVSKKLADSSEELSVVEIKQIKKNVEEEEITLG